MTESLLRLHHVGKTYGGPASSPVLSDINLTLGSGEFAALIGPSGSGKSTLLNIVGLLDRATSGEVVLAGRPVHEMTEAAVTAFRGQTLGFVSISFRASRLWTIATGACTAT